MLYINSLKLINKAIDNGLLEEIDGRVFIFRGETKDSKAGWWLEDKDTVAKELMRDKKGQDIIISELKKMSVEFVSTDYNIPEGANTIFTEKMFS